MILQGLKGLQSLSRPLLYKTGVVFQPGRTHHPAFYRIGGDRPCKLGKPCT